MKTSSLFELEKFLQEPLQSSFCFKSNSYPSYFVSNLLKLCEEKKVIAKKPRFIDPVSLDAISLESLFNQLVLGSVEWYWLGDCTPLFSEKKYEQHAKIIKSYQGPHCLIYFIDEKKVAAVSHKVVTLPALLQESDMDQCLQLLGKKNLYARKKKVIEALFKKVKALSLDKVLHCINYLELVNASSQEELLSYFLPLYEEDHSLFTLSNFFFAHDRDNFFSTWSVVEKKYPAPFWISFWSDQIWRAYFTTIFLKKGAIDKARTMSKRLPFAFIKAHWKYTSLEELEAAYTFLFRSDYAFKTGSTFCFFDLFFASFFDRKLKEDMFRRSNISSLETSYNEI